ANGAMAGNSVTIGGTGLSGTFTQSGSSAVSADDSITVASGSTYAITGGTISTPSLSNAGTFDYQSGSVTASVNNTGTLNARGTGRRTLSGALTNASGATVKMFGTRLEVDGVLSNSGTIDINDASFD